MLATEVALFALGLVAAFLGAELFVRAASSIATRFGIPPVVIGLTIVAWGTSSPELAVSLRAALQGESGVALGNVVGSNIFNVGIILGLAACIRPMSVKLSLLRVDAPILVGLTLLFCLLFFRGSSLSRADGALLLGVFVAYSWVTLAFTRREMPPEVREEFSREQPRLFKNVWVATMCLMGGLALLLYGGALLVDQALVLARATGVSERVIGLTIVAAATSFPELLTSVVAAIHRSADIAIGNIIGSNIFNLAAILGASSLITPIDAGGLALLDVGVLVVSSAVLLPVMWTRFTIDRREGVVLIGAYAVYVVALLA